MTDLTIRPAAPSRRFLGDFLGFDPIRAVANGAASGFEITKTDTGYAVELAVPGFKPEQLDVTIEDRVLTIVGKSERRSFTRALLLPDEIDAESVAATVEHGMLTLALSVHPKAQPRKISVSGTN
jgi:HSP20 family protein